MTSAEGNPEIERAIHDELGDLDPESVEMAGRQLTGEGFELTEEEAQQAMAAAKQLTDGETYRGQDGRGYEFRIIRNGSMLEIETDRDAD